MFDFDTENLSENFTNQHKACLGIYCTISQFFYSLPNDWCSRNQCTVGNSIHFPHWLIPNHIPYQRFPNVRFADHLNGTNHITAVDLNVELDLFADQLFSAGPSLGSAVPYHTWYQYPFYSAISNSLMYNFNHVYICTIYSIWYNQRLMVSTK